MTADIDALCEEIIAMHRDIYHPGMECAENEQGECLDRAGGEATSGPLGERRPLRTDTTPVTYPPTVDGLTIDLHRANRCLLTVFRHDGTFDRVMYPAPVTFIIGEAWLTLRPGDQKVIGPLPDGVTPRRATEADVLAWNPQSGKS